jgi:TonB-dependent receptor
MRIQPSRIALFAALAMFGGPAFAQTPSPQPADANAESDDEIVVTGQRGAINRARAAERNADSLVNVISSDNIGEFADQNVAESVRRVPGVNVAREEGEGRTMSVRGLPPAFTTVTVNGARIGSVDGDQSFVQLDSIGSELLDSITITKSVTPDMDGDSIGGSVELGSLSAFVRKEDSFSININGFNGERSDRWTPEYGLSFTKLLGNGKFGIAGSYSFSERDNYGDDLVNDAGLTPFSSVTPIAGFTPPLIGLRPNEIDHRLEIGTRRRTGGTLNFEFRPDDDNKAWLRFQYTLLDDDDGRFQNEYETDNADRSDEIISTGRGFANLRPRTTTQTGGPDIDKQIQLAENYDEIFVASLGSDHDLGKWSFGWQADTSAADSSNNGSYRARFRIRNVNLNTTFTETDVGVVATASGTRDPNNLSLYLFDDFRRSDIDRKDDIFSVKGDIRREFDLGGREAYIEVGGKFRARDVTRDTNVFNFNPQSATFNAVLSPQQRAALNSLPLFTGQSDIDQLGVFPDRGALRARMEQIFTAVRPLITPRLVETFGGDYLVDERTSAGYAMGQVKFGESLSVIGGVRVEQTDMRTQGFFLQLDDDDNPIPAPAVQLQDLGFTSQDYTEFLPSVHLLWRPVPELDVRASYNRGLQRPDFGDFANRQTYNFTTRELVAGNPGLEPTIADQLDFSVGWFPNRNTALQGSIFYKRFDKFFVSYDGPFLASAGITAPSVVASAPLGLDTTLNGEEATLLGLELGYTQVLSFLPGLLSGLFIEANATYVDSEASASNVRPGKFTLPGQADVLGNLSFGWENDRVTIRVAGNYVGESLEGISSATTQYLDQYKLAYTGVDFTARVAISDNVQWTLEASNLTEARDERVYAGNAESGRLFRQVEDFGRTVTTGFRLRF